MKFKLPRRQRKSFQTISGKPLDSNFNKKEALEVFEMVKKTYSVAPNSFGSVKGKKEDALEMLMIIGDQISKEYKDCVVIWRQGIPEITKVKD
tara:strand:- start:238 stop:516 length:279 start_codon:yes stop_codon:yes gene_type:complete